MPEDEKLTAQRERTSPGRRAFFLTALGGAVAALAGWVAGAFPRGPAITQEGGGGLTPSEARISALEARVSQLMEQLNAARAIPPFHAILTLGWPGGSSRYRWAARSIREIAGAYVRDC